MSKSECCGAEVKHVQDRFELGTHGNICLCCGKPCKVVDKPSPPTEDRLPLETFEKIGWIVDAIYNYTQTRQSGLAEIIAETASFYQGKIEELTRKGEQLCNAYGHALIEIHDLKQAVAEAEKRERIIKRDGVNNVSIYLKSKPYLNPKRWVLKN